jgi:hypothetical protein
MKMAIFWDVAPCSLINIHQRFREAYCRHHQGDVETVYSSETSGSINQALLRNIPENSGQYVFHYSYNI